MNCADKKIEMARKIKSIVACEYGVPVTSIIWKGGNNFIVVKDGQEITIEKAEVAE